MSVVIYGETTGHHTVQGWQPLTMLDLAGNISTLGRQPHFITSCHEIKEIAKNDDPFSDSNFQHAITYCDSHKVDLFAPYCLTPDVIQKIPFTGTCRELMNEDVYQPYALVAGGRALYRDSHPQLFIDKLTAQKPSQTFIFVPGTEEFSKCQPENPRATVDHFAMLADIVVATTEDLTRVYGFEPTEKNYLAIADYLLGIGSTIIFFVLDDGSSLVFNQQGDTLHIPGMETLSTKKEKIPTYIGAYVSALIEGLDRVSLLGRGTRSNLKNISVSQLYTVATLATATRGAAHELLRYRPLTRAEMMDSYLEYQSQHNLF